MADNRREISTSHAPRPGGAYSQGVAKQRVVAIAGQIGRDPQSGRMADGLEAQTRQALENVAAVLEAGGSSWADVIKTTCFLANIADFQVFNSVYAEVVPDPKPARSTVGVALAGDLLVEIEAIAILDHE